MKQYYEPVRLPFEGTMCGSGGEFKMCALLTKLDIIFAHCPFGVLTAPDFEVTTPVYFDRSGEDCNFHFIECKRTGWVMDALNGFLRPNELYSCKKLVELSMDTPVGIVEDFNKFTWLVAGTFVIERTTFLDKALVEFYHLDIVRVRHAVFLAMDDYALARRAANDNNSSDNQVAS